MTPKKRVLTVTASALFMAGFSVGPVFADTVDATTDESVPAAAPETQSQPLVPVVDGALDTVIEPLDLPGDPGGGHRR